MSHTFHRRCSLHVRLAADLHDCVPGDDRLLHVHRSATVRAAERQVPLPILVAD